MNSFHSLDEIDVLLSCNNPSSMQNSTQLSNTSSKSVNVSSPSLNKDNKFTFNNTQSECSNNFDSGVISSCDISSSITTESFANSQTYSTSSSSENNMEIIYKFDKSSLYNRSDSGVFVSDSSTHSNNDYTEKSNAERQILSVDYYKTINQYFSPVNEFQETYLHLCVCENYEDKVKEILELIPNSSFLNAQNICGETALHYAVLANLPNIVRLLFEAGAQTDIENINGDTALHLACKIKSRECVTALLDSLNNCCLIEKLNLQLRYKPESDLCEKYINEYNYQGLTCLHIAARCRDYEIMRLLLHYGADVNSHELSGGFTILHEAVESDLIDLVKCILKLPKLELEKMTYGHQTAYELTDSENLKSLLESYGCEPIIRMDSSSDVEDSEDDEKNVQLIKL